MIYKLLHNYIYVVDKNKVRRKVEKKRKELKENNLRVFKGASIKSLYIDGHKDETFQQISGHWKLISKEHIPLIEDPGSKYIDYISLTAGENAKEIAQGFIKLTKTNNMSFQNLSVIRCGRTNVSMGGKSRVIRLLEAYIKDCYNKMYVCYILSCH